MEVSKSADTGSGRLSRVCHCHGDVLGVVKMKGCKGGSLGSLRVCWKRYTESCWPIKKCEPSREKKLNAFVLSVVLVGAGVLVQVSWRTSVSLQVLVFLYPCVLLHVTGVLICRCAVAS